MPLDPQVRELSNYFSKLPQISYDKMTAQEARKLFNDSSLLLN